MGHVWRGDRLDSGNIGHDLFMRLHVLDRTAVARTTIQRPVEGRGYLPGSGGRTQRRFVSLGSTGPLRLGLGLIPRKRRGLTPVRSRGLEPHLLQLLHPSFELRDAPFQHRAPWTRRMDFPWLRHRRPISATVNSGNHKENGKQIPPERVRFPNPVSAGNTAFLLPSPRSRRKSVSLSYFITTQWRYQEPREWMGIEPTRDRVNDPSTALKAAGPTRRPDTPRQSPHQGITLTTTSNGVMFSASCGGLCQTRSTTASDVHSNAPYFYPRSPSATPTSSFTCETLLAKSRRSSSLSLTSMTFSTPAAPRTQGTPTK